MLAAIWAVALIAPATARTMTAYGRVAGTVHVVARGGAPLRSGDYPSRRVTAAATEPAEIANVVVFIKDAPADAELPPMHASIAQRDESFQPRVVAVTRSSTVEFPNFDPFFHDVFSLSRSATFDLGRFPKGERRVRTFVKPGIVKVYCHLHSQMAATILVFDHQLFAMPSAEGAYTIDGIPPGTYHLSAWHERIGELTKTIHVAAGETARMDFSLPVVEDRQ